MDGLWPHTAKTTTPFETDVQLPNITCPKCILQIVEFMAEHGYNKDGGYIYHHCASLNITADPAKARGQTLARRSLISRVLIIPQWGGRP